mmetsp:Transcript_26872/g.60096  ORF Transcript_26872/g.60096 Transcript_26872/m.60096 type:complete len:307 (-) Transcript_26872:42-962(-)
MAHVDESAPFRLVCGPRGPPVRFDRRARLKGADAPGVLVLEAGLAVLPEPAHHLAQRRRPARRAACRAAAVGEASRLVVEEPHPGLDLGPSESRRQGTGLARLVELAVLAGENAQRRYGQALLERGRGHRGHRVGARVEGRARRQGRGSSCLALGLAFGLALRVIGTFAAELEGEGGPLAEPEDGDPAAPHLVAQLVHQLRHQIPNVPRGSHRGQVGAKALEAARRDFLDDLLGRGRGEPFNGVTQHEDPLASAFGVGKVGDHHFFGAQRKLDDLASGWWRGCTAAYAHHCSQGSPLSLSLRPREL